MINSAGFSGAKPIERFTRPPASVRAPHTKVLALGKQRRALMAAPKTHLARIAGFQFVPNKLEVNVGDTVIWKNEDLVPHTATG